LRAQFIHAQGPSVPLWHRRAILIRLQLAGLFPGTTIGLLRKPGLASLALHLIDA